MKPAALAILLACWGCSKKHDIINIRADIITFSAREGHIYNIFALDRVHTHSYNAISNIDNRPWSFRINNVDILGDNGVLVIDPNVRSSIVIVRSTTSTVTFMNAGANQNKTVEMSAGAKFSIDFDNAQEAENIMGKSRDAQRDTLMALAADAATETFNVSTH